MSRAWPVPTWRLPAALAGVALVVLPLATEWEVAWLAGNLAVLLAAAVDAVLARPRQVEVRREVEQVLVLDTPARLRWAVTNRGGRGIRVHLADAIGESLRVDDRRARLTLPPRATKTADAQLRPARRGRHELGPITLRVGGPLGLMSRQLDVPVRDVIQVHPAFPSREETELRLHQAQRMAEGLRTVRLRGQGTDFESLREYTPDDETRRIDWAATARALKPIVRTYRAERNQQVLVLLDHGRTMAGRVGRVPVQDGPDLQAAETLLARAPRLEHALDATMALARIATGLGDRVGLVTFSDEVTATLPPRTGRAQMVRLVQALAGVEVELVEPDYRGAFGEALALYRRRALVVVMTELAAAPVSESLRPALPLLGRRHLLMVASPADPTVRHWADAVPRDAAAAYRMAAATDALEQRRHVARSLQALGATVVDAPPTTLPGLLIDAYLDAKAGRL